MVSLSNPRNATLKSGVTITQAGICLVNDSTNNKLQKCTATSIALGVSADESERDASGLVSGGTVSYYPVGGVLMVASKASQAFKTGDTVYIAADGYATKTAGSSKKLGLYVGEGVTTGSSDGDLVPVNTSGAAIA
jgi:hypothetical protein